MDLDRHMNCAENIRNIVQHTHSLGRKVNLHYPQSSAVVKKYNKLLIALSNLRCELDSQYHLLITDSMFLQLGHIYYAPPVPLSTP
jgi:hypothetical protein